MHNERGIALGIVTVMAFVLALASAALMTVGLSRGSTSAKERKRLQARYVAEAGLVWAMQRLWVDPDFCVTNSVLDLNGVKTKVSLADCGVGNTQTITSKVVY